jgi:fructan beta-fructosidase
LGDFGPAGVPDKPNWECPDLFELPIEGEPGKTRWVLEVDMGNGSIAGGSGGEYFIGSFDGQRFQCEHDPRKSQWVDYGRDFYAPVSWSDIPRSDGRRIWLGWMNNWETNLLPTHPWRGGMSIPRSLSLGRTENGLRLIQTPVRELQSLRVDPVHREEIKVSSGEIPLASQGISGDQLEIMVEFEIGDAREFGLLVRKGKNQRTRIGYDVERKELFIDRTQSGESAFHPKFPGRHAGPLPPRKGRVAIHIFIDTSSVEVFGGHGETVITDCIFPDPESRDVVLYSTGGTATAKTLDAWKLKSVW